MRKLTQAEFIDRCVLAWGDRYDISQVEYKNSRSEVTIVCKTHGPFRVTAKNFAYANSGCPICGGQRSRTTAEFKILAKNVHGDRFNYSEVLYATHDSSVKIICREHGPFFQQPIVHLRGSICPKCAGVGRVTTNDFITRASAIFGDLYNYTSTKYVSPLEKVSIFCNKHGEFMQYPYNHLSGSGCRKCAMEKIGDERRMTEARASTDCSKRGLRLIKYAGCANESSEIACRLGHTWSAPISRINRGSGCPTCAITGYNPNKPGYVYALVSTCKQYMKIGLSNNPKSRVRSLRCTTPFKFSLYGIAKMQGMYAPKFETLMHRKSISANFNGFDGCTEWFLFCEHVANEVRLFNSEN